MKPRLLPRERYPRFSRFAFRGWRGESALHMRHDFREKLPGSLIARIIEEFRWRRVFDDCAVTHEQHTIGYPSGKPISWVTTTMVIWAWASSTITSRTSAIISGSRADVGSSNRITFGSRARVRAK